MLERLRRALGRLKCAEDSGGTASRPAPAKNVVRRAVDDEHIRRAVESMAREYPAGAVKWLLLEATGSTCPGESRP
jgi:hypothetical protein